MAKDAFERFRQLRGITPSVSMPVQIQQAASATLSAPPANHSAPCPHTRQYVRIEGTHLCIQCWCALAPDGTVWAPEAPLAYCDDGTHDYAPEDSRMPGIRQCQRCPAVVKSVEVAP